MRTIVLPAFLILSLGSFQFVTVLDDDDGIDQFEIETSSLLTGYGFDIDFKTTNTTLLRSDALPLSINPIYFETATFSLAPFEGSQLPSFSGRIDAELPVPEPGSLALVAPGLLGPAWAWWRQRHPKMGRPAA
ncbi:MAG TPA: PEP-CTERM sorting domain-containing protein [Aliidongia sp.]|nr:PEP-CTERM sorting domain-containing protein [Aliidongia sp.]